MSLSSFILSTKDCRIELSDSVSQPTSRLEKNAKRKYLMTVLLDDGTNGPIDSDPIDFTSREWCIEDAPYESGCALRPLNATPARPRIYPHRARCCNLRHRPRCRGP